MRGLLEKDFRLLKGQKNFFLLILVITVLLSLNSEDNFAVTYLTFIAGFLTISSFGYDDNGNCMPFLTCNKQEFSHLFRWRDELQNILIKSKKNTCSVAGCVI